MLARLEHLTELPLMLLAFVMVPLILGPLLWDISPEGLETVFALDLLVWAIFAIDLVAKVAVAPDRWGYVKKHPIDVLVVVIPFLRPLRLLRLFLYGYRAAVGARRLISLDFLLVYGFGLMIIMATVVTTAEHNAGGTIRTFPDALWWAMSTVTTVGYGDVVPVTTAGRAAAFVLMVGGITFFSAITANIAAFIVKSDNASEKAKDDGQEETVQRLTKEIEGLKREVGRLKR